MPYCHGCPQRTARGALAPPPVRPRPAKNSMFLDFFRKNSIFSIVLRQKVGFCPPGKFLPSPWKKSADAHAYCAPPLATLLFWPILIHSSFISKGCVVIFKLFINVWKRDVCVQNCVQKCICCWELSVFYTGATAQGLFGFWLQ